MVVQMTPSWVLTDESGGDPVVRNRHTGAVHGPDDVVAMYPSWGLQPVRNSVRRVAGAGNLTADQESLVSRFCGPGRPTEITADAHVHLRVPMSKKSQWVRAAQRSGTNLSDWLTGLADAQVARDEGE